MGYLVRYPLRNPSVATGMWKVPRTFPPSWDAQGGLRRRYERVDDRRGSGRPHAPYAAVRLLKSRWHARQPVRSP
eukprot:gene1635-biopygen8614